MAWYRKTDTSWNQISNMYRRTNDLETADLISGRYTDSSRAWRRIKAAYRFTGSAWVKVFSKLAGQPYATTAPSLSYNNYLSGGGTDIASSYVIMGPKNTSLSNTIAQSNTGTTYLWGNNGVWDNDTSATIAATFIYNYTNNSSSASNVLDDEGNYNGDKLRNESGIIDNYDEAYVWYKIAKTSPTGSTGTAYSNSVQILKQPPSISFFASSGTSGISPGSYAEFTFGVSSLWYDSADLYKSYMNWYLLDSSTQTPSSSNLVQTNYLYTAYGTGTFSYFIPNTAAGKFLYVVLKVVNSYNDRSISNAPGPDVTLARGPYELIANVPAGTDNTAEFSRDSQDGYNYSVTNVGTWTNTPTSYRYQWYRRVYSSPTVFTWSPISGATSSTFNASSYKLGEIIPVVWASNAAGESDFFLTGFGLRDSGGNDIASSAGGITPAARLTVYYKAPVISTFTIDGSVSGKFTPTFSYTSDDPLRIVSMSWTGSGSGSLSAVSSGTQYTLAGGTYDFVLKVQNQNDALDENNYFSTYSRNATVSAQVYPQPFNTTSLVMGKYGDVLTGYRQLTFKWEASTNAVYYRQRYEYSSDGVTWTNAQIFGNSAAFSTGLEDTFYIATSSRFIRAAVRAEDASNTSTNAAYSDGGTNINIAYRNATGTAPQAPTINSTSGTSTSITVNYSFPTGSNTGSAPISNAQVSSDGVNWTDDTASPYTFTSLSPGTYYFLYVRAVNTDGLAGPSASVYATTAPGTPSGVSVVRNQGSWNGSQWSWSASWSAPSSGGTTYYEAYRQVGTGSVGSASLTSITNTSTPQNITAPTTSTTFTTTVQAANRADAYVRACNSAGCSSYVSGNVG